jgi:hypothetical protein
MARFNVTTPAAGHTGAVGGVHFVDGKAEVDDEKNASELAYFRAQGYGVEPVEDDKAAEEQPAPKRTRKPAAKEEEKDQ